MENNIKKIHIFLVTKDKQVKDEYLELYDFIGEINQKLQKSYNLKIYFDMIDSEQRHEKYSKQMCESDIVFFLVYTSVAEFIKLDFYAAYNQFKSYGKPVIYTYFNKAADGIRSPETLAFMKDLDEKIYHFYSFYEHVDTIKLKILMLLKLGSLNMAEMSFDKGRLIMDGVEIMPLDNVKMVADNTSLNHLYRELENAEKEYYSLLSAYSKNKDDKTLYGKYTDAAVKLMRIHDDIERTEKILFEKSLNLIRDSAKGEMTVRQREACRLLEDGDLEGANAALDFNEMKNDFRHKMEIRKKEDKILASVYIKEVIYKINICEVMTECKNRFNDIAEFYKDIMQVSFEYGVEYDTVREYAVFLDDYGYSKESYDIIKKLEEIYNRENIDNYYKALLYDTAGVTANHICDKYNEAEEYHKKAIAIIEGLAEKEPYRHKQNMAAIYNNAGNFYKNQGNFQQAEECYLRTANIFEWLTENDSALYESALAGTYGNIATLYSARGQNSEAENYHKKNIAIFEKLAKNNPDAYEPALATGYDNAGNFYKNQHEYEKAKEYFIKAAEIRERLVNKDRDLYEHDLTISYNNLGILYDISWLSDDNALDFYLKAIAIREKLAEKDPYKYEPYLADSYNNLGAFWSDRKEYQKAEEYFLKSVSIRERLFDNNSDRYGAVLADSYNNLGVVCKNLGKNKETEEYYLKAISIYEKYAEDHPDVYGKNLVSLYNNINDFYNNSGQIQKAELYHPKALAMIEKLAKACPDIYKPVLAVNYSHTGFIYSLKRQKKEAEKYFIKAVELTESLAEKEPVQYGTSLVNIYRNVSAFYGKFGQNKKAEEYYQKAMKAFETLSKNYPDWNYPYPK